MRPAETEMAFIENNENGLIYMTSTLIPARHAFTTRYGGVSEGDFASLNFASNTGDPQEHVTENHRRLAAVFGVGKDDCAVTKQVHGTDVRIVTATDRHICGTATPYIADGLVTAERGLPILCFAADCIPVILCDAEHGVIGAVHCGWRGSVKDILGTAVEKMRALGARPENICAAMGAALGRCCFESDDDVPDAVTEYLGGDTDGLFDRRADGKTMVDLRAANARRLIQLGLKEENIDISTECTMCSHEKYWSHRYTQRHGMKRGSQTAAIML